MEKPGVTFLYLSQEDVLKTKVGMKEVIEEVETVLSPVSYTHLHYYELYLDNTSRIQSPLKCPQ